MTYLRDRGVTFLVIPHAADETPGQPRPNGFEAADVVRTVVLETGHGHALCVVPELQGLDLDLAREAVADPTARLAPVDQVQRSYPEYEPGALPPLGLFFAAPMYVDPQVIRRETIVFRGGRHDISIRVATGALFRDDPVVITPLTPGSASRTGEGTPAPAG